MRLRDNKVRQGRQYDRADTDASRERTDVELTRLATDTTCCRPYVKTNDKEAKYSNGLAYTAMPKRC